MPDSTPSKAPSPALERIFRAAERLFAERGFDSVSIRDVAREAGVSKANIFHHFASKQALYETVLTRACEALGAQIDRLFPAGTDPALRVTNFFVWYRDYVRAHRSSARLLFREVTGNTDLAESGPVFRLLSRLFDKVVARVRDARDAGAFRADANPTVVASLMLGLALFDAQTEHFAADSGVARCRRRRLRRCS